MCIDQNADWCDCIARVLQIPFFGLTGNHNGVPGVYAPGSPWADEASSAIQLYSWIWFGITSVYLVSRQSSSISPNARVLFCHVFHGRVSS